MPCSKTGHTELLENAASPSDGRLLLFALIISFSIATAFQGTRGIFDSTEGRYAQCAAEMVKSGDYIVPTLDGHPHWSKPPLTYWAIAAGLRLFGKNPWGARAYLIAAFVLTVFFVYLLGLGMYDKRTGEIAALVYASLAGPVAASNTVNTDSLLTMFIAAYIAFWWLAVSGKKQKIHVTAMWTALGFAFLTKGPPSLLFLLPLIVTGIWMKRKGIPRPSFFSTAGSLIFVTVGLGWYIYCVATFPGLLDYWVKDEIIGRVATNEFHRNPEWYKAFRVYLPYLLFGSLPWIGLAIFIYRDKLLTIPKRHDLARLWKAINGASAQSFFLGTSILIPLIIFSISASKLSLYVLPIFVPIAVFLARVILQSLHTKRLSRKALLMTAIGVAAVFITAKGIFAHIPVKRDATAIAQKILTHLPGDKDKIVLLIVDSKPKYGIQFSLPIKSHWISTKPDPFHNPPLVSQLPLWITRNIPKGYRPVLLVEKEHVFLVRQVFGIYKTGFSLTPIIGKWFLMSIPVYADPQNSALSPA